MFENFKLIHRLVLLDKTAIIKIANRKSATGDGLLILLLAGIASVIGIRPIFELEKYKDIAFEFNLNNVFSLAILFVIVSSLYIGFSFLIARLLGGTCQFKQYFRALAFVNVLNLFNLSLNLATFASIWMIIINYNVLKTLNNFTPFQSFLTLISTFLSLFALVSVLS